MGVTGFTRARFPLSLHPSSLHPLSSPSPPFNFILSPNDGKVNNHQSSGGIDDVSIIKTGSAPGFVVSDNEIPVTPAMLYTSLNATKSTELISGLSYNSLENSGFINKVDASYASLHPRLYSIGRESSRSQTDQTMATEANNLASQSQWLRPSSPGDCAMSNNKLNEHEDLTIDEGTIRAVAVVLSNTALPPNDRLSITRHVACYRQRYRYRLALANSTSSIFDCMDVDCIDFITTASGITTAWRHHLDGIVPQLAFGSITSTAAIADGISLSPGNSFQ
ncbi:hypothetical protein KSP40_PGU016767 [Platanthera guangdongensis]|uniref:Uncharacterized protein n=1 Tax=Platanthera guangdongensis TaxID=2320717 RepID=A0ABR2MYD1_9ASPA